MTNMCHKPEPAHSMEQTLHKRTQTQEEKTIIVLGLRKFANFAIAKTQSICESMKYVVMC